MIAGNFPFELFESYKNLIKPNTLGNVINTLNSKIIIDPTYKYELDSEDLTDHILEENLHFEELRINKESKTHHPIYNGMSFPELLNRPSRTITSTCTRVSRESLIIESKDGYRRLTVRERATLMGFPLTYQFYGNSFNSKLKMIGNAIPPILTYYIFQSMLGIQPKKLKFIDEVKNYIHNAPSQPIPITPPDKAKFRYRESRSFRLAIPEFRFGSGVRFELSNEFIEATCRWSIRFYYGTSKRIMEVAINTELFDKVQKTLKYQKIDIKKEIQSLEIYGRGISSESLQKRWVHENQEGVHPFEVLDMVSSLGMQIKEKIDGVEFSDLDFELLLGENLNNKLFDNKSLIIAGLITGYVINKNLKL
jgi:DNA (cytosine-5)-methyltransferase 1